MSFNRLMHPRNIYMKRPDFKTLALNDPEFAKYCYLGLNGKVSFDFTSQEGLRYLTTLLLKKDYNLDVCIPPDKLVPTLTSRLNYILWIEDLLQGIENKDGHYIIGVDIGTGASCIFPLLAAKKNNWKMLATEINECSVEIARENVRKNNLQDMIEVKHVDSDTFLVKGIDTEKKYDFCMTNPSFYISGDELEKASSRTGERKPPSNSRNGLAHGLSAPGGEIEFIKRIMRDSLKLKNQIRIYTTMIGHKSSLKILEEELKNLDVCSIAKAQFFQGRALRWGLAWTFDPSIKLGNFLPTLENRKKKPSKIVKTLKWAIPAQYGFDESVNEVDDLVSRLQILFSRRIYIKNHTWKIVAYVDTWLNQRQPEDAESRSDEMDMDGDNEVEGNDGNDNGVEGNQESDDKGESSNKRPHDMVENGKVVKSFKKSPGDHINKQKKRKPIFKAYIVLTEGPENRVLLQITPLEGSKEAADQMLQFLKNNFMKRE